MENRLQFSMDEKFDSQIVRERILRTSRGEINLKEIIFYDEETGDTIQSKAGAPYQFTRLEAIESGYIHRYWSNVKLPVEPVQRNEKTFKFDGRPFYVTSRNRFSGREATLYIPLSYIGECEVKIINRHYRELQTQKYMFLVTEDFGFMLDLWTEYDVIGMKAEVAQRLLNVETRDDMKALAEWIKQTC